MQNNTKYVGVELTKYVFGLAINDIVVAMPRYKLYAVRHVTWRSVLSFLVSCVLHLV
jgi:hypothetical protein